MAFNIKSKKYSSPNSQFNLCITLFFISLFTIPTFFLLNNTTTNSTCTNLTKTFSGDLLSAEFAWNSLLFSQRNNPSPIVLKIAVFSRKWPTGTVPGGMERHAHTLHTALAHRGHQVHVFTSPSEEDEATTTTSISSKGAPFSPYIHFHEGEPGKWRYNKAWELFLEENQRDQPFDVVHSESVALPHWLAKELPNLVVSWHGIALESLQSSIFQDLARLPDEQSRVCICPLCPKVTDSKFMRIKTSLTHFFKPHPSKASIHIFFNFLIASCVVENRTKMLTLSASKIMSYTCQAFLLSKIM